MATCAFISLALFLLLHRMAHAGCPFQNPFWFVEKPIVVHVLDQHSQVVPNRVRVMWGRMENFKCVDYFQVQYFQRLNPGQSMMTPRINRHRRSVEIEVVPCTEYYFKVIASEDWKGMREDFKVFSDVVAFKLDYTPKFINQPNVVEHFRSGTTDEEALEQQKARERMRFRERQREERRRYEEQLQQQDRNNYMVPAADEAGVDYYPVFVTETTPEPEEYPITVRWRLEDIDYPMCLSYFMLDYYDTLYNESAFSRTFARPFHHNVFELDIPNRVIPCSADHEFIIRAYGLTQNAGATQTYWTPGSCIVTTTPATTTTTTVTTEYTPEETTTDVSIKMEEIQAENDRLQAKIDGLKQEYEKIGLQVFYSFKESFFQSLEDFLARRKAETGNNNGGGGGFFGTDDDEEEVQTTTVEYDYNSYNDSDSGGFFGWYDEKNLLKHSSTSVK